MKSPPQRLCLVLLGSMAMVASTVQADPAPEASILHQRFIQAVGGPAAIRHITAMSASGTIMLPGSDESGSFAWSVADGDRCIFEMSFPGLGSSAFGNTGTEAWEDINLGEANRTIRRIDADDVDKRRTKSNWFELALTLGDRATSFETIGPSTFDGQSAWEVLMVDRADRIHHLYFDQTTDLLLGVRLIEQGPTGPAHVTVRFTDWKPVDDIKLFRRVAVDHDAIRMTLHFNTISLKPIPQTRFNPPADLPGPSPPDTTDE